MRHQDLLAKVLTLARQQRPPVMAYSVPDSRRATAIGFPDLVLCGQYAAMFAELKVPPDDLSSTQVVWKYRLMGAGERYAIWTPKDLKSGEISKALALLNSREAAR